MKNCVLAVVLSAVVLFAWGFLSWTILPWHNAVANKFADESAVSSVLKENAPAAGMYYLPFAQEDLKPGALFALANVLPDGVDGTMGGMMGLGLLGQAVSAALVILLLCKNLDSWTTGDGSVSSRLRAWPSVLSATFRTGTGSASRLPIRSSSSSTP